jgi:hypothetical protein
MLLGTGFYFLLLVQQHSRFLLHLILDFTSYTQLTVHITTSLFVFCFLLSFLIPYSLVLPPILNNSTYNLYALCPSLLSYVLLTIGLIGLILISLNT